MKIYWSDREGRPAPQGCTFHVHSFSHPDQIPSASQTQIFDLPPPVSIKVLKRTFLPAKKMWMQGVEKALQLIRQKELQKVVLARICILELEKIADPFAIASALKKKAQGAHIFCLQTEEEAFLGASPERLFQREGHQIVSEVVAGTRRRGQTAKEDQKLQKQLFLSAKDHREFSPVQEYLQKNLSPLCLSPLSFTPVSIHKTQNVQHLFSRCSSKLKEGITDEQILASLHPTPALCGTPRQKAFSTIQELEPFERGLYGGVLGWKTPAASEWIVAIRSCLLHPREKKAILFSGTGIVEGSDPEEEWDELNQKLKLYDGILAD